MTLFDSSTLVTASFPSVAPTLAGMRRRRRGTAPLLSESMMTNSALGQPDEIQIVGPSSADDAMILALKNSTRTPHILGVSTRKLKSLKFRLRRRDLKIVQSGTPFNKRDCLKNTNR